MTGGEEGGKGGGRWGRPPFKNAAFAATALPALAGALERGWGETLFGRAKLGGSTHRSDGREVGQPLKRPTATEARWGLKRPRARGGRILCENYFCRDTSRVGGFDAAQGKWSVAKRGNLATAALCSFA